MYTDPIADLLVRIKNASRARKDTVKAPYSTKKENILKVLKARKFIKDFQIEGKDVEKCLMIEISDDHRDIEMKRISKPGQRIYVKSTEIKKVNGGMGINIISTPKGIISGEEAKKLNVGGEHLCQIY